MGTSRLLLLALAGTLLLACGPTPDRRDAARRAADTGVRGIVLPTPVDVPDFTLTDTEGRRFHLPTELEGRITLLFFGYTNCPDICPVHVANIAAVLDDLPYEQRDRFRMVFVTTDPERDTPERLRAWLDRFDPDFVGLWGELERVNEIQQALMLPAAVIQQRRDGGEDYLVGHASQVIALSPDARARIVYPSGIRQADWAHDLPRLAEGRWPSPEG